VLARCRVAALGLLLLASPVLADVQLKSGASTDTLTINTQKAALTTAGNSTRVTYVASSSALVTTALYSLAIEAAAGTGFKLVSFCVGFSNATAAAGITIDVKRTTAASSGGTALTAEGTGADAISKMDPGDANFTGVARRTGTLTTGVTLDQYGAMVGELGAGAADPTSLPIFCKQYGQNGEKMPVVAAGTTNGIAIRVSAPGAGGLAFGSISAVIIQE
jgi:hypothetical protein